VTISVACTFILLVLGRAIPGSVRAVLLALAFIMLAVTVTRRQWRAALTMRAVMATGIALLAVAVVAPPRESRDVWSYALYGRMVSHYDTNPYTTDPQDVGDDVFAQKIGPRWRDDPSVYGPGFTAASAGIMAVVGDSTVGARVGFQLLAATAALGVLIIVAKRTRDPTAVACLAFNPLLVLLVVNDAHNDALVGLAILGGAVLLADEHPLLGAGVLAAGGLVKIAALLAVPAAVLWVWHRAGARRAFAAGGVAALTFAIPMLLAGGRDVLTPLDRARGLSSRGSVWQFTRSGPVTRVFSFIQHADSPIPHWASQLAMVTVAALALYLAYTYRREVTPYLAIGAALAAYLLVAAYVLPWYAAWTLPVLALQWRSRLSVLVAAQSALWAVAYQFEKGLDLGNFHAVLWALCVATMIVNLIVIAGLVAASVRRKPAADLIAA